MLKMITKDEAIKMVEEAHDYCNISEIFDKTDCYIFNLVRKDNGITSVASPVKVDKKTGEMSRMDILREAREKSKGKADREIPSWMLSVKSNR